MNANKVRKAVELPDPIGARSSIDDVARWLNDLYVMHILWHMDSSPYRVTFTFANLSDRQLSRLDSSRSWALHICKARGVDIFDLYPDVLRSPHTEPDELAVYKAIANHLYGLKFTLSEGLDLRLEELRREYPDSSHKALHWEIPVDIFTGKSHGE